MWPNVDSVTNQSLFDQNYSHTLFSVLSPLYYLTWVLINSSISGIADGSQGQEYPFTLYVKRWLNNPCCVFLCWCLKFTTKLFCLCMIYYFVFICCVEPSSPVLTCAVRVLGEVWLVPGGHSAHPQRRQQDSWRQSQGTCYRRWTVLVHDTFLHNILSTVFFNMYMTVDISKYLNTKFFFRIKNAILYLQTTILNTVHLKNKNIVLKETLNILRVAKV